MSFVHDGFFYALFLMNGLSRVFILLIFKEVFPSSLTLRTILKLLPPSDGNAKRARFTFNIVQLAGGFGGDYINLNVYVNNILNVKQN